MLNNTSPIIKALHAYTYWHCGDEVLAKALVQDSIELAGSFSQETSSQETKELHRHAIRIVRRELRYLDHLDHLGNKDCNTDRYNEEPRGRHATLRRLLRRLKFEHRDVVVFHLICGYNVQRIAEILNVTRREIRRRLTSAKQEI